MAIRGRNRTTSVLVHAKEKLRTFKYALHITLCWRTFVYSTQTNYSTIRGRMDIYYFQNGNFSKRPMNELFLCEWDEGENEEDFLEKNGYSICPEEFLGIIKVYPRDASHSSTEETYVTIEVLDCNNLEVFVPNYIELIKLFNFLGLNLTELRKYNFQRILDPSELPDDPEYESVVRVSDDKIWIKSHDPIQTYREERDAVQKRRKLHQKKNEQQV